MTNSAILKTENICKSYTLGKENIPVLHNISLSVEKGSYAAIMGQSGAGKSTLLNILGCLDKATSGQYYINKINVSRLTDSELAKIRNEQIGFIFQNFNLLPKLTVAANIELPLIYANIKRKERKERVESVMQKLGIYERRNHKPNEISGGQKQRVAIARALIKNPALLLADEPTGNLDSHTTEEILALFQKLNDEGNTIVMITHEHDVAAKAKNIIRLVDGAIVNN
jgi:putative ABC transport system ATP-binding protein